MEFVQKIEKMDLSDGYDQEPEKVAPTRKHSGTVKWFNPTKGFGFITPDNGTADVFVHQSEIMLPGFRSLAQGERVEYTLYDGEKGPKALSVTGPEGERVKGAPRAPKPSEPIKMGLDQGSIQQQIQKHLQNLALVQQLPNNHQSNLNPQRTPILNSQQVPPTIFATPAPSPFIFNHTANQFPVGMIPMSPVHTPQFQFPMSMSPTPIGMNGSFAFPELTPKQPQTTMFSPTDYSQLMSFDTRYMNNAYDNNQYVSNSFLTRR